MNAVPEESAADADIDLDAEALRDAVEDAWMNPAECTENEAAVIQLGGAL